MIFWICSIVTLATALIASFVGDIRRAVLALWVCGLGVGGLYLSMGAELLAVIQWIAATLVAISFIFYAVMFGEYGVVEKISLSKKIISSIVPLGVGAGFATIVWIGAHNLPGAMEVGSFFEKIQGPHDPNVVAGGGLSDLGKALADNHLLSLEILALTLFLVIVGSGVVARSEVVDR